mmetsp:Transcript_5333/g.12090  ORF Transcript_5333/g.12090 Transcript_5333/m.12090 type:complete len:220 (+) Transcript_5333:3-662(+)
MIHNTSLEITVACNGAAQTGQHTHPFLCFRWSWRCQDFGWMKEGLSLPSNTQAINSAYWTLPSWSASMSWKSDCTLSSVHFGPLVRAVRTLRSSSRLMCPSPSASQFLNCCRTRACSLSLRSRACASCFLIFSSFDDRSLASASSSSPPASARACETSGRRMYLSFDCSLSTFCRVSCAASILFVRSATANGTSSRSPLRSHWVAWSTPQIFTVLSERR